MLYLKMIIGLAVSTLGVAVPSALAQVDPLSGIDFVTIDRPNNAPWPGGPFPQNNLIGRGSVGYEYRIGRFEITTAQYGEFLNAAYDRPRTEWIPNISIPEIWGANNTAPTVPTGRRWAWVPGDMAPVGGISWRSAAIYCNWLHNGKSLDRSAFLSGAYDTSTFGYNGNIFTDQLTRSAGAKYFIPTLDEWMKAAHYDPNRHGENQPGWWLYSHTSDVPAIPGQPGEITPQGPAQANYGGSRFDPVPDLGAYAGVTSPWGLFDTAGATTEWTEEVRDLGGSWSRIVEGSQWYVNGSSGDAVWRFGNSADPRTSSYEFGVRIAAVVPAPTTACAMICVVLTYIGRRRR